jgi:hypothetical protein
VHQASSQSGAAEPQARETGQALAALKKQVGVENRGTRACLPGR